MLDDTGNEGEDADPSSLLNATAALPTRGFQDKGLFHLRGGKEAVLMEYPEVRFQPHEYYPPVSQGLGVRG